MIVKDSIELDDNELLKKVELIKKTVTDWKAILAANKLGFKEKDELEMIDRMEEFMNTILEMLEEIDEIDKEEEAINRLIEMLKGRDEEAEEKSKAEMEAKLKIEAKRSLKQKQKRC